MSELNVSTAKQSKPDRTMEWRSRNLAQPTASTVIDQPVVPAPRTVSEVVVWGIDTYSQTLVFLPSAIKAAKSSPYRSPAKLQKLLQALHEVGLELQKGSGRLRNGLFQALAAKGFRYKAKVSQTAVGKYPEDYSFLFNNRKVLFGEHVTLGAGQANTCMSVHFLVDPQTHQIVIGWCGRHGGNTSS